MKIIDEIEMPKKPKTNKPTKTEGQGGTEPIVKGWELNYFIVHLRFKIFKVRFSPVNM